MTALDAPPGTEPTTLDLAAAEEVLRHFRHAELVPGTDNLRATLTDLTDLAESIAELGILQPLRVDLNDQGRPVIVAGHRRHAAIGQLIDDGRWPAGRRIPCILEGAAADDGLNDIERRTLQMLVENLQRVDLDPIEEANGYRRLQQADTSWTVKVIAATIGRPEDRVRARLKLLDLPPFFQTAVSERRLTLDLAARLCAAPPAVVDKLAAKKQLPGDYQLSDAIRVHGIDEQDDLFRTNAHARGLTITRDGYSLIRSHIEHSTCTPAELADVLLPADLTGWCASITHWNGQNSTVRIWQPKSDAPAAPRELNKFEAYEQKLADLREADVAAERAWREAGREAQARFARHATAKDVAAAALEYLICTTDATYYARHLGYEDPPDDVEVDPDEVFQAWLRADAKNLVAVAALIIVDDEYDCPASFRDQFLAWWDTPAPEPAKQPKAPAGYKQWCDAGRPHDLDVDA